jgi:hypothetical protein
VLQDRTAESLSHVKAGAAAFTERMSGRVLVAPGEPTRHTWYRYRCARDREHAASICRVLNAAGGIFICSARVRRSARGTNLSTTGFSSPGRNDTKFFTVRIELRSNCGSLIGGAK